MEGKSGSVRRASPGSMTGEMWAKGCWPWGQPVSSKMHLSLLPKTMVITNPRPW